MSSIYTKNMKALQKMNAILAKKIDNLIYKKDDFELEKLKNGSGYTIKLQVDDKEKYIHSPYNPVKQAKKEVDKINIEFYNLIGVAGIGCGYFIREILNRFNKSSQIIIIENRLDILKEVMQVQDMTDIFKIRNVQIFDGSNPKFNLKMKQWLRRIDYNALAAGNIDFFKTPVLKDKYSEEFKTYVNEFFEVLNYVVNSLGNDPGDTLIGIEHGFQNVKYLLNNSFDFRNLDYYKNKPAIIVATGPSLDKNIDVLKKYQDNALVLSAGTSLHKLLKYGVKPDIFSVLERPEKVYNYTIRDIVEEGEFPEGIVPILDGVVHPKIYNNVNDNVIPVFRDTVTTEKWFVENIEDLVGLDTGLSVANLAFQIAYLLQCSPIILVGQDLSFSPDGRRHSKDTKYDELGERELKNHEVVEVTGYNGEKLKARKLWKQFKNWFEYIIKKEDVCCIDATEGGAYIKGTEVKTLQETADLFLNDKVRSFNEFINFDSSDKVELKAERLQKACNDKIEIFKDIKKEIEDILDIIKMSKKEIKSQKNIKEYARKQFIEINTKTAEMNQRDGVFFFICQAPFVQMERYKVQMGNLMVNTEKKFLDFCDYYLDILKSIHNICETTIEYFEKGNDNINELILEL